MEKKEIYYGIFNLNLALPLWKVLSLFKYFTYLKTPMAQNFIIIKLLDSKELTKAPSIDKPLKFESHLFIALRKEW